MNTEAIKLISERINEPWCEAKRGLCNFTCDHHEARRWLDREALSNRDGLKVAAFEYVESVYCQTCHRAKEPDYSKLITADNLPQLLDWYQGDSGLCTDIDGTRMTLAIRLAKEGVGTMESAFGVCVMLIAEAIEQREKEEADASTG